MIYLLLPLLGYAAMPTDFANVYYCPEGYCLDKKVMGGGFVGPQSNFVQCKKGEMTADVTTYNYYIANGKQVDFGNMWSMEKNLQALPPTYQGAMKAYCCEGYDGAQCEHMVKTDDDKMGCCYNVGYGSRMVECCQKAHDNMKDANDEGMLGASKCPVNKLMGGAVKFMEGYSCEKLEGLGWSTTHTFESYKIAVGTLSEDECKSKSAGHGGKWKKNNCMTPKSAKKVKCKKLKGKWCTDVGCAFKGKKKKCTGKPFQ